MVQTLAINDMTEQDEEKSSHFPWLFSEKLGTVFSLFEDLLPPFCLPSLHPSACMFRGFCLSASSSSTLSTAVPYAPSMKGPNHQES